jgi:hypothetical protein
MILKLFNHVKATCYTVRNKEQYLNKGLADGSKNTIFALAWRLWGGERINTSTPPEKLTIQLRFKLDTKHPTITSICLIPANCVAH